MAVNRTAVFAVLVSLGAHGAGYAGLQHARDDLPPPVELAASVVSFTVESAPKPEPPPAPVPTEAPTPPPVESVLRTPAPPVERAPDSKAPPPIDEPPSHAVDLTGVTLTAEGGGFAMSAGSGERREAPLRAGPLAARPSPGKEPKRAASSKPTPSANRGPRVLPLADLSHRPAAPNLNGELQRLYPAAARAAGISGTATVRARISASGVAGAVRLVSESGAGFGSACLQTVSGSRWSPPLDAAGHPVATEITYRCKFLVH